MAKIATLLSNLRNFGTTFARVQKMAWSVSKPLYIGQLLLNIVTGLTPVATAFLAGQVVSQLATILSHPGTSLNHMYVLVVLLGVTQLVSNQLNYLLSYFDSLYSLKFDGYIWENLLIQYCRLDQTYYDDPDFNSKFNKIQQNIFSMRTLSSQSFNLLSDGVQIVATAIALLAFEPWLVVVVLVGLTPVVIIEASASLKRWRYWDTVGDDFRRQNYARNSLTDNTKIREIKLYGLTEWFTKRWHDLFELVRGGQVKIARTAERQRSGASVLDAIVQLGIQLWLIRLVIGRGVAGIGQFVFYRQIIQNFVSAGASGVRTFQQMQDSALYVNDYFEFQSYQPRLIEAKNPQKLEVQGAPTIEFRDVSYRYPNSKKWALRHMNLIIQPGEDIAIIGENGAGKTTFVKLLMRLYDPTEGQILLNGIDLRDMDLNNWSKRIGILFQDFNKYGPFTLLENIKLGKINQAVDEKNIMKAIKQAGGDALLADLPNGIDTILTNSFWDGVDLSGGQWQRVALARAFYRDAPILVLDEPTSAIDAKGEYEIFQQIKRVQENKTTIIISHRFSTVRNADRIIVVDKGRINEQGSHEELMKIDGIYHRLFELQAAGYR